MPMATVSFAFWNTEHYPDPLVHCIPSASKLHLPLGIRMFHGIFISRVNFPEKFHLMRKFSRKYENVHFRFNPNLTWACLGKQKKLGSLSEGDGTTRAESGGQQSGVSSAK
jgi:hypothetical protein